MGQRIAILGVTGFIGSSLYDELEHANQVIGFARRRDDGLRESDERRVHKDIRLINLRLVRINTLFPHSEKYGHPLALAEMLSFRRLIYQSITN